VANNSHTAKQLIDRVDVNVLLIARHLPHETGIQFATSLAGFDVTAFLSLPVEDSCFWVPVLDRGRNCLGAPALRPSEFAQAIEELSQTDGLWATDTQPVAGKVKP
jgi:hypothetical protein